MDYGDVPAWVAAGVALVAAIIALVVATYSKRQAGAAEDQARAAQDQIVLLRKQIEMAEQDRHEQNAPQFTISHNLSFGYVGEASWHTISYTSGPSQLDKIVISPGPGSEVDGVGIDVDEQSKRSSIELTSIVSGVEYEFVAWLNDKDSGVVFLVSAEAASSRWKSKSVTATED